VLAILEFSQPRGWLTRTAYGAYSRFVLPVIGGLVSGSREAYTYLPESIARFPSADLLREMMEASGFRDVRYDLLTRGIAALHVGVKQTC
jgi:demethylmenaquinone methyltransferase/2-methoxy-6-polyprenyl-1,4-benzoquinol methylase